MNNTENFIDIISLNDFKLKCENNFCLRKTFISKQCELNSKRESCYEKYLKLKQKKYEKVLLKNPKYEKWVKEIWIRDCGFYDGLFKRSNWKKYCKMWKCLTTFDKEFLEKNCSDILYINRDLDCCHILEKSTNPELKYNIENGVICGRLFHSRLDRYLHPVYETSINSKERIDWFTRSRDYE